MNKAKEGDEYISRKRRNVDLIVSLDQHDNDNSKLLLNNKKKKKKRTIVTNKNNHNNNESNIDDIDQIVYDEDATIDNCIVDESIHNEKNNSSSSSTTTINSAISKDICKVSWGKVVEIFTQSFENVFTVNSKLYFDVAMQKIDGATVKWCPIILLDTLISFAVESSNESKFNEALKRKFNQYNALHQAVCAVVSESYIFNSKDLIKNNKFHNNIETFPINIKVIDIPDEWMEIEKFKTYACCHVLGSKSNYKMIEIVDSLISHHYVKEVGIVEAIKIVVSKIYKDHFTMTSLDNIADFHNQGFSYTNEQETSSGNIER